MYVLIILAGFAGYVAGMAPVTSVFADKALCDDAAVWAKQHRNVDAACFPRSAVK